MDTKELEARLLALEKRVDQIDVRLEVVEQHVRSTLDQFGNYRTRNIEELTLMQGQIESMTNSVESLISAAEYGAGVERAKSLLRRLRNNQTRINKQLKGRKSHG
jgi:hypothetical protein